MKDFSLLYEFTAGLCHDLYRCVRIDAMLIEYAERLDAEVAQGVFAHPSDVGRSAVLFGLYLDSVHELMSEFGGHEDPVRVAFQSLAHKFLVDVVTVALGGVEERYAALDSLVNQGNLHLARWMLAAVVVQAHTSIAHRGDRQRGLATAKWERSGCVWESLNAEG